MPFFKSLSLFIVAFFPNNVTFNLIISLFIYLLVHLYILHRLFIWIVILHVLSINLIMNMNCFPREGFDDNGLS